MARLLSQNAVIIRGSIGGITYSANQFHQIIARARTSPAQFPSNLQTQFRASFAAACLDWAVLTPPQRAAWDLFAPSIPYTGPLGSYVVNGREIFLGARTLVRYYNVRFLASLTLLPGAPVLPGRYAMLAAYIGPPALAATGFRLYLTNSGAQPVAYIVNCSKPFLQTRLKWKGPWDSAQQKNGTLAPGAAALAISFTAPAIDLAYFVEITAVTASVVGVPHIFTTNQILRAVSSLGV